MKTIIVWFRNDLRLHDHPALWNASQNSDQVVPVFIFDTAIYEGAHASANRNKFLYECLSDLNSSLKNAGANLVIREGKADKVLAELADETNADAVYFTYDYTPYSVKRDENVKQALRRKNIDVKAFPGRLIVDNVRGLATKQGTPHKVFTPFWKNWARQTRREIVPTPQKLSLPSNVRLGKILPLETLTKARQLSPNTLKGGETEAKKRLKTFLNEDVKTYHEQNNDLAADSTSRLSPYLHLGCLSVRDIESQLGNSDGEAAWHRQLAWRDFYHYVLYHNPDNLKKEFQEKYRSLKWRTSKKDLEAWQNGQTGYPVVDAAMRQLAQEGWMHNRARLIAGSFLTKDLWLDWRAGEAYFMEMLLDGDEPNNNGNWQWIASVGVDPAPVYRRLYNPSSQRDKYDPTGAYVRKYVPELKYVDDKYLTEPWKMPAEAQEKAGCIIGKDYPAPIVDHKEVREYALEQYRSV